VGRRNLVVRADGRRVNVARPRGQLFVCATGCCCGRTDHGFPAVPTKVYHNEWEQRRLRTVVHLTIGGCLGPCALANVVLLLFDGQALWFHSINSEALVGALYDHIEAMRDADGCLPSPALLVPHQFTASAWQPRPDGQPPSEGGDQLLRRRSVMSRTMPSR
jgi:cobaltochelatase CobN